MKKILSAIAAFWFSVVPASAANQAPIQTPYGRVNGCAAANACKAGTVTLPRTITDFGDIPMTDALSAGAR